MARPDKKLAGLLEGLTPIDAVRAIARAEGELAAVVPPPGVDRARLVVTTYEARGLSDENRKKSGVFYTPVEVVEAMLDRVALEGTILDPSAGAGAFLVALVHRLGAAALDRIYACDLDASALDASALALEALLGPGHRPRIEAWRASHTFVGDFLRATPPFAPFDLVVGNPPYGLWGGDDLPKLFPELAGEVDTYACFVVQALRRVKPSGTVALLVPDTWLTNARSAAFRTALVARSRVRRVVDFGKPFASARDTRVHALVLQQGAQRCDIESTRDGQLVPMAPVTHADLVRDRARGWFLYRTPAEVEAFDAMARHALPLGRVFDVIYGLRTGDNGTYVGEGPGIIPLLGGADFDAYDRHPVTKHLERPARFMTPIEKQGGRWRIGIQRIRTNSKVSWRRWVEAALVEPKEIGLDSLTLVARAGPITGELDDALLCLLGVLNSSVVNRWYRLLYTDVNVKPVYVATIPVPPASAPLAALVRKRLENRGDLVLERAIDRLVADAYGLSDAHVACLEEGFWGEELAHRPLPSRAAALALVGAT